MDRVKNKISEGWIAAYGKAFTFHRTPSGHGARPARTGYPTPERLRRSAEETRR